jgi:hypothetical protein
LLQQLSRQQQQHATQLLLQPQQAAQQQAPHGAGAAGAAAGARAGTAASGDASSSGVYMVHSESSYGAEASTTGSRVSEGTSSTQPAVRAGQPLA